MKTRIATIFKGNLYVSGTGDDWYLIGRDPTRCVKTPRFSDLY